MANGTVKTEPLITHKLFVTECEEAFNNFEEKKGIKMLLQPVG
jgi:threonine dehydrogenase-like Zn-dependent dehydrogenase